MSQPSAGSCDSPAWGSSNYIVGIGSVIQPIEAPTLNPGQWRLLTEDSIGDPVTLSEVFTVLACDACSREFAVEAVNRWKQTAATNQVGAGIACSVLEVKAALDEAKEIGLVKTDWTPTGITLVSIGYSLGGGFAFSVANPFEVSQQKALAILKDLTCAVSNMYDDIVKDPPDPNYGTVIVPVFGTVDDLASPEATALARSLSRQVGLADASLTSFERYLGAAADNDAAGVARQATATADQTFQLVAELRSSAAALETFAAYADTQPELSGPVAATQTEIDELAAAYQRVRTSGFTPGELAQLTAIPFSPAEIAAFTTNFERDLSVITPGVSLGDYARTLATTMRSSIPDLDAFAREASAVGARNELDLGVNLPPTAEFVATPASGVAPLAVSFDASASADPDGTISSYTWDFGDGNGSTGVTTSHTYVTPGTYSAALTVADDGGATVSASTTIVVTTGGGGGRGRGPDRRLHPCARYRPRAHHGAARRVGLVGRRDDRVVCVVVQRRDNGNGAHRIAHLRLRRKPHCATDGHGRRGLDGVNPTRELGQGFVGDSGAHLRRCR